MARRTLMHRNRELVTFEVDPTTGEARVIDASEPGVNLLASEGSAWRGADKALTRIVRKRTISPSREDERDILAAFGAKSGVDLALMGHGLSLSDLLWYRVPGSTERWEDINFFDNEWDPGFGMAVLLGDYARLEACSPDVPDATTPGHALKMWERSEEGIFLIKAPERPDGADLAGAKLASDLCAALFAEGRYVPLNIVERRGRICSSSPLMLSGEEELIDGGQLFSTARIQRSYKLDGKAKSIAEELDARISAYAAIGVADGSAHVARMGCCSCLSLLADFNPSNYGAIRRVESGTWRAAPIFDYDGAFGFMSNNNSLITALCNAPRFAQLFCAGLFSYLKPFWDWTWYDSRALEGFEDRIVEAYAPYQSLPPHFGELIASLFVMQRKYVDEIASGGSVE